MNEKRTRIVLTVEDLRIVLDPSGIDIDDDVTFAVHQGEVLGLVGESASGKTTAATSLLAHQRRGARIAGGRVDIEGIDVLKATAAALRRIRGGLISYVPQDASAALNPALRIDFQLLEILRVHGFGSSQAERDARLTQMMEEVLLPTDRAFLRRYPHQLSGGQQQRVAIAMAFACRPKVIVLDEPTTALDVTTQAHVLETIRDLTRSYGVSALYVTHDLAVVANLADRIAVMYAGRLVEIGPKEELFAGAWHPFKIEGPIELRGKALARDSRQRSRDERQAIQYIFQSPYSSLNPRKTIRQLLAQPLNVFFDLGRDEMEDRMVRVLDQVALDDSLLGRYPEQLSGGERQRVAIARGLAAEPTVLICDEVTSWLDVSVQAAIIELLSDLQRELGVSMLFVTHNLALIRSISQEVAVMSEGRIVEFGLVDAVLEDPQAEYTRNLLADTPSLELVRASRATP